MDTINSVLLLDNYSIIRFGASLLIQQMLPRVTIFQSANFQEAISVTQYQKPDLIIFDIDVPDGAGIDMIGILKLRHPATKLLVYTSYDELIYGIRYMHAGADGFLSKNAETDYLKLAVSKILRGEKYISDQLKKQYLNDLMNKSPETDSLLATLSNRELEIASLLTKGTTSSEIATLLNLQVSTVSTYKTRIFGKLKVSNVLQLIVKMKIYGV